MVCFLLSRGIERGAVTRFGDRLVDGPGSFQPEFDGLPQLRDGAFRRVAMRGAQTQIGYIGDPALVVGVPEQVDMIARFPAHGAKTTHLCGGGARRTASVFEVRPRWKMRAYKPLSGGALLYRKLKA
jgi:hypothetical protein